VASVFCNSGQEENSDMTDKEKDFKSMLDSGVVAVLRAKDSAQLYNVAKALAEGGVHSIEVTMTTPNALAVINEVSQKMGAECLVGVGSVLDPETARAAILAGARFVVGPALNLDVIKLCRRYSKIVVPGTFTPTEMMTAWEAGADLCKLFPAGVVGPEYIKDIHGPFPQIEIIPTGGVDEKTTVDFIKAGAAAVAAGSAMVPKDALAKGDFNAIREMGAKFVAAVKKGRGQA
jgi:2-dehydro-3-deoxyphosphogluconate aldolase/(4S)-4-hydroxy-2-oxoglutarate aldolase